MVQQLVQQAMIPVEPISLLNPKSRRHQCTCWTTLMWDHVYFKTFFSLFLLRNLPSTFPCTWTPDLGPAVFETIFSCIFRVALKEDFQFVLPASEGDGWWTSVTKSNQSCSASSIWCSLSHITTVQYCYTVHWRTMWAVWVAIWKIKVTGLES